MEQQECFRENLDEIDRYFYLTSKITSGPVVVKSHIIENIEPAEEEQFKPMITTSTIPDNHMAIEIGKLQDDFQKKMKVQAEEIITKINALEKANEEAEIHRIEAKAEELLDQAKKMKEAMKRKYEDSP